MSNVRNYLLRVLECDESNESKRARDEIIAVVEEHPKITEEGLSRLLASLAVWPWTNWGMVVLYLASQRKRNAVPFDAAVEGWDNAVGKAITKVLSENEVPRTVRHEDAMPALRQATENIFARIGDRTARIVTIESLYRVLSTHNRDRPKPIWVPTDADKEADPLKILYTESQKAGMLVFDRMLFDEISDTGDRGRGYVEKLKERRLAHWSEFTGQQPSLLPETHPNVWHLWTEPENRALAIVADVAWHDVVKPALEKERHPATPTELFPDIIRATKGRISRHEEPRTGQWSVTRRQDAGVPGLLQDPDKYFSRRVPAREGILRRRLVWTLPHEASVVQRRLNLDSSEARPVVSFKGGLLECGRRIGAHGARSPDLLGALAWGREYQVTGPDGTIYLGLWDFTYKPGGKHALLEVVPAKLFLAGHQEAFIPIPHHMPRLEGVDAREHSALLDFALGFLCEMRDRGREIYAEVKAGREPSIRLDAADIRRLADRYDVSSKTCAEIFDRLWVSGKDAFLRPVGKDRWTLGSAYERELSLIVEGSRRSWIGSKARTKQIESKARNRDRIEGKP